MTRTQDLSPWWAVWAPLLVLVVCQTAQASVVKKLDNGLTIVAQQDTDSDTFGLSILIRATGYDDLNKPGLRNVMARALLSGPASGNSGAALDLLRRLRDVDGGAAAYTESDYIEVFAYGPSAFFDEVLDFIGASCVTPAFSPDGVAAAAKAATASIEERDTGAVTAAVGRVRQQLYPAFPVHDTLGLAASVEAITREDIVQAAKRLLVGRRIVTGIVGPQPEAELVAAVERHLGALPAGQPYQPPDELALMRTVYGDEPLPALEYRRYVATDQRSHGFLVCLAYAIPSLGEPGWATAELVAALLGGDRVGRLSEDPVLDLYAYGATCVALRQLDHNLLVAYAATRQAQALEPVRARMVEAIASLGGEAVAQEQLEQARQYILGRERSSHLTTHQQARELAWGIMAGLGEPAYQAIAEALGKVSVDEVRQFVRERLNDACRAMAVLMPEPKFDPSLVQFPGLRPETSEKKTVP